MATLLARCSFPYSLFEPPYCPQRPAAGAIKSKLFISKGGKFDYKETLKAGDCGWAYVREQANTDNPARPLIIDAYKPGTKEFDQKIWGGKVIVLRIDGSVKTMRLAPNGKILVGGKDLLTKESAPWAESDEDPAQLLMQPEPAKAAKAKAP